MYLLFTLFALGAHSHSWLHCTNYEGDLETFEPENCLGNPRPLSSGNNVNDNSFGQDIGMNYQPGASRCQGNVAAGLGANYPNGIQTYETGRTYTLAWPPKNHVAAECTNAFIPDAFLKLYMAPYDGNTDPDQETFRNMQVPASFSDTPHQNGVMDFQGFQNCPRFCENTDKALCTGTFSIPEGTAPGTYTFQWYWAFNSEADLYATCYEAEVVAGSGNGGNDGGNNGGTETTPQPTATTTLPPGCDDTCCKPGETIAPGTGTVVDYDAILNLDSEYVNCPSGYSGTFKMMCINAVAQHVDGWCLLAASANEEEIANKNSAITGLSLALVAVTLAFIAYVSITREWVTWDTFSSGPPAKPGNDKRKMTVTTLSNTELPVVPDAPAQQWHYVDENEKSIGPVSEAAVLLWAKKVGNERAKQAWVWNGTTVSEWTPMSDVPSLMSKLNNSLV